MTIGLAGPPQPWWCLARAAPSRMRPRKRGRLPSLEGQRGSDPGHRSRPRRGTSAEPSRTRSSTGCRSGRRRSGNRSCPRSSGSTGAVALEDNRRRRSSLEVQHPRALRQARSRHRSPPRRRKVSPRRSCHRHRKRRQRQRRADFLRPPSLRTAQLRLYWRREYRRKQRSTPRRRQLACRRSGNEASNRQFPRTANVQSTTVVTSRASTPRTWPRPRRGEPRAFAPRHEQAIPASGLNDHASCGPCWL